MAKTQEQPYRLCLCTGRWIRVDPTNIDSLNYAESAVRDAMSSVGDGSTLRTAAWRQLAQIVTQRGALQR